MEEVSLIEPPISESYDVVIVGAGPAGSSAAQAAARKGAKVLLIDRKQCIGVPMQCAEFVSQWISHHALFSSRCILQSIETMAIHLSDEISYEIRGPGYVLDRTLFDKELSASAILSGAQISIETRAIGLHSGKVMVERGGQKAIIQATVIIGADGVHSSIARWIGQPSIKTIVALQYEIVLPEPQNHVDIFFHKDYEGGYGWLFPKGRTANVGIGVTPSKASLLPELMNQFLNRLMGSKRIFGIHIVGKTGGSVPCEPYQQTVFGNILLVGDAAGHAHPISGAGILNAVIGGEIAGRVASETVDRGDLRYLENYEMEWREILGKSLSYGVFKREFLEENWSRAGTNFEELIRRTWVTFKEYHEDRRKR